MPEPHLRAGDSDRAAVALVLGRHMADGRLTVAEYDERVARAYAARTYGELDHLTTDLPTTDASRTREPAVRQQPAPSHGCAPAAGPWARGGHTAASWRSWQRTALIVLAIWAATSIMTASFVPFWPIWVIGPWGAVLLAQTLSGRDGHRRRRSHQRT
jgi:hypothetical protein